MNRSPPSLALEKLHAPSQFAALAKTPLEARDVDPIRCRRWLQAQLGQAPADRDSVLSESSGLRPPDPAIFLMSCLGWTRPKKSDRSPFHLPPKAEVEDKPGLQSPGQSTQSRLFRPSRPSPGSHSLS